MKDTSVSLRDRKSFAQIHCSTALLHTETGIYEHGQYIQANQHICQIGVNCVEDEQHVILRCDYYNDLCKNLCRYASDINPDLY